MQNIKLLIAVIVGTLVVVVGAAFLFSGDETKAAREFNPALVAGLERNVRSSAGEEEEASFSAEATTSGQNQGEMLTLVEFSDFECPACRNAQALIKQIIEKEYPGKVRLIYRHFPLETIHEKARIGAIASEAAARQGKFWEYHDLLFERQEEWVEAGETEKKFIGYAEELGLDGDRFAEDMASEEVVAIVDKDVADGLALAINATPTFFLENELVSLSNLSVAIAQRLE